MTLDKKIKQLRDEEARFKRCAAMACANDFESESKRVNTVAADELGQLADWLEELRRYKDLEERGDRRAERAGGRTDSRGGMSMKYRKKPVVIEAMQWDGKDLLELSGFVGDAMLIVPGAVMIRTLEGDLRVSRGDYIIKGVQGEFYPCKPDIFEKTYEVCEEE